MTTRVSTRVAPNTPSPRATMNALFVIAGLLITWVGISAL
jgi:hypothetical protein